MAGNYKAEREASRRLQAGTPMPVPIHPAPKPDWGNNAVAPLNHYARELVTACDKMDNFDLDSNNEESRVQFGKLRRDYIIASFRLVNLVSKNYKKMKDQLRDL